MPVISNEECGDGLHVANLPGSLLAQAALRGGTYWWPGEAARQVIQVYAQRQIAVIGVDLAYLRGDKTFATMEFCDMSRDEIPDDWPEYVRAFAEQAVAFVASRCHRPGAYFDLTAVASHSESG